MDEKFLQLVDALGAQTQEVLWLYLGYKFTTFVLGWAFSLALLSGGARILVAIILSGSDYASEFDKRRACWWIAPWLPNPTPCPKEDD